MIEYWDLTRCASGVNDPNGSGFYGNEIQGAMTSFEIDNAYEKVKWKYLGKCIPLGTLALIITEQGLCKYVIASPKVHCYVEVKCCIMR